MPLAPASRAFLICQLELEVTPVAEILTMGLGPPIFPRAPCIAATLSAAPGTNGIRPCSQSMATHDRW